MSDRPEEEARAVAEEPRDSRNHADVGSKVNAIIEAAEAAAEEIAQGARSKARNLLFVHDADRLEIACDRPLPLQADGEDLGDVEHAVFEAERDAIDVLA